MRNDILERKEEILQWIEEERPKSYICQQLNCKQDTLNSYLKKMNIEYAGQQAKKGQFKGGNKYKSALYYIENNIPITSSKLREKLIRDGLKPNYCEKCHTFEWYGIKLPLELHHKNGKHYDNSLENLEILCPNCHSIQEGNSGANIKRNS
jgi:RNase P subunit RPR2